MADEARLHEILDLVEQARREGDTETEAKAIAAYRQESPQRYGSGKSYDVQVGGGLAPTGSPEAQAGYSPISGNSFGRNALIGSGKFFTDVGLGGRQLYATAADTLDSQGNNLSSLVTGQQSRLSDLQQEAANKREIDAPVMATGGGKFGQIGTGVLSALPLAAIPGAGTYAGAAAIGAGYGALTPTTENDSRLLNTGLGAGLGIAGKYAGDKLGRALSNWLAARRGAVPVAEANSSATIGPSAAGAEANVTGSANMSASGGGYTFGTVGPDASAGLSRSQQQIMQTGQAMGMRLTPGQASGSRALQQLEAKLESQPMTSGPFNDIKAANQSVVDSAWAQAMGAKPQPVDSALLASVNDRLGSVFESVRNRNSIIATNPEATTTALDNIDESVRGLLPGGANIRNNPLVSDLETLAQSGGITGKQLGQLSSKLGRAAAKQMTSQGGDRDWGQALFEVKNHVDDLLQQSLSGPEAVEYAAARQQYRAMMQVTARTGNVNPSTGHVSSPNMANYLQKSDRRGYLFGGNESDAYNAVRFGQAFKPIVGDSGTATRSALPSPVNFLMSVPLNLATKAYLSAPSIAVASGAKTIGSKVPTGLLEAMQALGRTTRPGLPGLTGISIPYLTQ